MGTESANPFCERKFRMAQKEKFPTMVTPRGLAAFTWLTKKDTKYNANGVYKVSVVLDKKDMSEGRVEFGSETLPGAAWVKNILSICKSNGVPSTPGERSCPVKDGDKMIDKYGKKKFAGKLVMEFKTGYKPSVIDTKGIALPQSVEVLNGDMIKVAFNPVYREVNGNHYLSMYLSKVMLVEKVVESAGGAEMFGESDGGYEVPEDARVAVDMGFSGEDDGSVEEHDDPDF